MKGELTFGSVKKLSDKELLKRLNKIGMKKGVRDSSILTIEATKRMFRILNKIQKEKK